jgi:23S rRNA pseudouridine1911/1915/1917 synthase
VVEDNRTANLLHETSEWIIFNKPSGWHTLASDYDEGLSFEKWLKENRPEQAKIPESGIVQRLDHSTSGCLLVAKSAAGYEKLRERISNREAGVQKIYLALVQGKAKAGHFRFYFTGRYKRSRKVTVKKTGKVQNMGECSWSVKEARENSTLLEVSLLGPGQRHQIRAGLAFLGHPIRGDKLYGG